ncbi:hypothetical protein GCM10007940_21820 [Portibacter lacus]|uniref:Uncharacterized protein n=2 Tax=Portibacter lacus TaxID=1099794 RepID=A0AA37SPC6_9BACT|nr:hypothetical protein [Portibacter lacus]GLR17567.1 hypothetical protein GCM10007940_21820 [Portibacter lacus]
MAVLPCTDAMSCDSEEIAAFAEHDHSEDKEDACAPFCVCQCCGITIDITEAKGLSVNASEHIFSYSFPYNFTYSYDHFRSAWHPPATV